MKDWRSITLGHPSPVSFLSKVVNYPFKDTGKWKMVGRNPLSREGSHEGCNCSQCGGGHSVGGLGKESEEIHSPEGGGEKPGGKVVQFGKFAGREMLAAPP